MRYNKIRLEDLREELNISIKEISKEIGVSDSIYSKWEKDKDNIPTRRLVQLANFFSVNIDYILGLSDVRIKTNYSLEIDIKIVSQRVYEIRKDFNESLRKFTKRLNTSSSTWNAYEKGKVLILGSFLLEVCKIGNYSADWILGKSKNKYLDR